MRKLLMLYSALLILHPAQAQEKNVHFLQAPQTAWAVGARVGVNMSSVVGNQPPNYITDGKSGAYLGFVFNKAIGRGWAIQPAFYYSAQGYIQNWSGSGAGTYRERRTLGYFNLPVQIQYLTAAGFTIQTGPQAGLLFVNDYGDDTGSTLDWATGVSYISKSGIGVEAGYILGLTSLMSNSYYSGPSQPSSVNYTLKQRVFQAGLVYYFAVAKKRPPRT